MGFVATDAQSTDGITVGLIDAVISICGVISSRDRTSDSVREALKHLAQDKDVIAVIKSANRACNGA